jgi:hypothetical protein
MFRPYDECLVYNSTNLPNLSIIFPILLHHGLNATWITISFNCKYPSMHVHTSHRCYNVHLLNYAHNNEHTGTHDAIRNIFTTFTPCGMKTITRTSFNHIPLLSSQVNIVFTKDGICTLIEVVIADWTRMELFCQSYRTQRFVVSKVAQTKGKNYHN